MWATFAAPETDLLRLAKLAPVVATDATDIVRVFRGALGPGIGSEVDLSRPAFLATGSDADERVAFSVALARANFGAALPTSLQLTAKRPGVENLILRDGQAHTWIGERAACEVHRRPPPHGLLVCAPDRAGLDAFGDFVAGAAGSAGQLPALYVEMREGFLHKTFADEPAWSLVTSSLGAGLESMSWAVALSASGLNVDQTFTFGETHAPLSRLMAAPRRASKPGAPDFRELPPDTLVAISLAGAEPTAKRDESAKQDAGARPELTPHETFGNPAALLAVLSDLGPMGVAYGLDLTAAQKRLQDWVLADAKSGGAAPPGQFEPVHDWVVYRVAESLDKLRSHLGELVPGAGKMVKKPIAVEQVKPGPKRKPALESVPLTRVDALPGGSMHVVSRGDDPEELHAYLVPVGGAALIVVSRAVDSARAAARGAVKHQKTSVYSSYFQRSDGAALAGAGFARPELFTALGLNYESSYARERSLKSLLALAKAPERSTPAAPLRYRIEQLDGSKARATCSALLPTAAANLWVKGIVNLFGGI